MTKVKIAPNTIVRNFLRGRLTDINPARSGQWIFDDPPRLEDLGDTSFPRISIIIIDQSGESLGIFNDNSFDTALLQVDCWVKKSNVYTRSVTSEALGTMGSTVNSDRFTTEFIPTTNIDIKHDGTSYGTITVVNTDADFTVPGSLAADEVEISKSTGNLNFSSSDVTSHDGEAITVDYDVKLEGEEAAKHLAMEVVKAIRSNWRTDGNFSGLFYPVRLSGPVPIPLDQDLGVYRYTVDYQVRGFNMGEGL